MSKKLEAFDWKSLPVKWVIGVDEVGRGCLAGSVYAAAVAFKIEEDFSVYKDSKLLSAKKREELSLRITECHYSAVGFANVNEIDSINIFQASFLAMRRALMALPLENNWQKDAVVLVDGAYPIPDFSVRKQIALVKGDRRSPQIAAASILAKVTRDNEMSKLAEQFPQYGFEKHKAYATKAHIEAITTHGPCPEHRKTFAPIKQMLQETQL